MRIGSLVVASSVSVVIENDSEWVEQRYSAGKGKRFAMILIGVEDKKRGSERIDPEQVLIRMGWTPPKE